MGGMNNLGSGWSLALLLLEVEELLTADLTFSAL